MPRIAKKTLSHVEGVANAFDLTSSDAWALYHAARTLHRWHEQECGDSNDHCSWCITRDANGKPFREICSHAGGKNRMVPIRDMEAGALRRIKAICDRNGLCFYVQTDPRGGTLYLARGPLTDSDYSSHGTFLA